MKNISIRRKRFGQCGFSLIELLVSMVVIAILAAVALPSYRDYVRRGNRAAAEAHMMDLAAREGQYLIDNRAYADTVAALGMSTPADVSGNYAVTIATASSPANFTITAAPQGDQASDSCGTLTLDSAGAKTPATGRCW